ncbi:MAG: hypothetical protein IPM85_15630 [Chitinophagaceae bacterium]|nr:hypothetical protein [Chitinophagaceae bacterium]
MKAKRKKGFRLLAFLLLAIWLSSGKLEAQQIAVDRVSGWRVYGVFL